MKKKLLTIAALMIITSAHANKVDDLIHEVIPNTKIQKIEKADELNGFYRVYVENGQMFYVDPLNKNILFGELWNNKGQSITQIFIRKWQQELQEKQIDGLSPSELTANALKLEFGKGSAQYEFVVFTDPECPYCKKAEDVIVKKDVTVYINYMPLSFHKNAREWSLDILSSTNPKQALADIKSGKQVKVKHTKEAETRLAKMEELAKKLNVTGTPKLFVIDKKENKIIDVINGANVSQIESFIK